MKNALLLVAALFLLASCTQERKTANGFTFTVLKKGEGEFAKPGTYLQLEMVAKDSKDSVWLDTYKEGIPMVVEVPGPESEKQEQGVQGIFRQLANGDSIMFKVSPEMLFEKTWNQPVPANVDRTGFFTYTIRVTNVLDTDGVRKFQQEQVAKLNARYAVRMKEQRATDSVTIENHLAAKNLKAERTATGLRYIITKPGAGPTAKRGQQVLVHYAGYLLDGTLFDTSIEKVAKEKGAYDPQNPYVPYQLVVDFKQVIQGWDEVLQYMNKGCKVTVFIPSHLAYGERGSGERIKPNTVLSFDMELVDIRK